MQKYNGHRSWNAWNVSLWINNDEGLYNLAQDCVKRPTKKGNKANLSLATYRMLNYLRGEKTPDGAVYNFTTVKLAIEDIYKTFNN